ncbi:zinc ABC transporter substrate-binding protein [Thioalkalivibrio paradoxus]|uniref:High-affinity zinc uptake system protein ZnuA n=1 Tax=Thioalkalivibrio paradoxus ARh 1 TaxID=713585 RepID=W0DJI1_9GAMM|nr:zinc ABC transporter substrate-binding protein [Thioalkalivibrio paradoxus]AHE98749.1 ABC transporter substrate-binding protein [Thioalkalivibrio paradoxus ARh 1]
MQFGKFPAIGALLFATAFGTSTVQAETRTVVASILPVHSLVAALVDGVHDTEVLMPASASPHGYAMRPSEARRLQDADMVVWVGPDLETFLQRALAGSREGRKVVTLMEDLDLELLPTREGGVWEAHSHDHGHHDHGHHDHGHHDHGHHDHGHHDHGHHDHGHHDHGPHDHGHHDHGHHDHGHHDHGHHDHEHHDHGHHDHGHHDHGHHDHGHNDHGHHHGEMDAHIWLSPENARRIAIGMTDVLAGWDPANAQAFADNRDRLLDRIDALDTDLRAQLEPVRDRAFIVFHDAYQYFEHHYGLNAAGSITLDPAQAPGARRIQSLQNRLAEDDVVCLFTEPQFRPALAQMLVEGRPTRLGDLDPLGSELEPGPDAWFELMRGLADDLSGCLEAPAS